MNALICRNCGAGLEADKIDHSLRIITCSHCGSMHDMSSEASPPAVGEKDSTDTKAPPPKVERHEVALPKRFKMHRTAGGMEITWPVGSVIHGVVLVIIAAGFTYVAVTSGMYFLILASVGLVYFAAVRTFNKHRIRTDNVSLQVTQGPLPWPGTRKLIVSEIEQLFSIEYEVRRQTGTDSDNDQDRKVEIIKLYQLSARTRTDQRVKLLRGLGDPLQALWLEQEIERSLGIRDTRVAGEHWT